MKKLITLCTLLLCAVVTSWTDAYDVTDDEVIILNQVYSSSESGYSTHSAIAWGGTASTNSKKAGDPANNGEATSSNVNCYSVKGNGGGKNITVSVKNCSKIIVYHEKHSSRYVELRSGTKKGDLIGKGAASTYYTEVALDDTETYTIFLHGTTGSDDQDLNVYAVKLFAPAAPIITTQPVGADYAVGDPIAPLSVGATASAGTLSYQWYSCSDAEKTGASEITGATGASYTPTAAGFYYVVVTDDKGFVVSNVVEITISAASAPTINVTGAPVGDIVKDTEVTLTAVAEGVPTPTIQWYSNTTATTSGGVEIDGETNETYSPSTAATGTFYYYAIATNSQGSTTSALQTLVVKEKVATPDLPKEGFFNTDTKSITITCATEEAVVEYSLNEGATWTTYSDPIAISADATVWARATKDGCIDSEVAKATYQKFSYDKSELASVNESTTWDWTSWNETLQLDEVSKVTTNDEYTFADIIDIYGLTPPDGFKGGAISFKGQYPVRSKKSQAGTWTVKTSVAGSFAITFSDTGTSGTSVKRYLNVNGVNSEYYTQRTGKANDQKTVTLKLPAGTYAFTGMAEDGTTPQALCMYKIVFTAVPFVSHTIPESRFCTYSTNYPVDLSTISGGTAYIATGVDGGKVTLEKCEAKVPAATGLLIACEEEAEFKINTLPLLLRLLPSTCSLVSLTAALCLLVSMCLHGPRVLLLMQVSISSILNSLISATTRLILMCLLAVPACRFRSARMPARLLASAR